MQLSEHFSLEEFTASQTATRLGICNTPTAKHKAAMKVLCESTLEPVRGLASPIIVSSGYRSPALNAAIGGSSRSQHSKGEAADITALSLTPYELCQAILAAGIPFDQLIYEGRWVHISSVEEGNRMNVLTAHFARGKPVRYTNGLSNA